METFCSWNGPSIFKWVAVTWPAVQVLGTRVACPTAERGFSLPHPIVQYIPRNMHTDFVLLCFVVVIHWLIFPYPPGLLHWHCGNLTIAPVPAKQPWWIWVNTSCEFIMNDYITTTKQSTTKPCAYFLEYTVQACSSTKPYMKPYSSDGICHVQVNFYHRPYHMHSLQN